MALHHLSLDAPLPDSCQAGAVSIGNFDGVHLGHQALLRELVRHAKASGGPGVAVTFDPHPQELLHPDSFQPILTTLQQRAELLHKHGVDQVVVFRITAEFLKLTPQEFFERILRQKLRARAIVEGFSFGFGRSRAGNTAVLQALGSEAGIGVTLVPALALVGKPISTSRVRTELLAGNVAVAATLLGRPYRLGGRVIAGERRGHTIGFPTANLAEIATLIPGDGVYAVRVHTEGATFAGAANVGPNPTFGERARKVEAHLIGFGGDLYGKPLALDFIERIRDTRRFAGAAELAEQLKKDVEAAWRFGALETRIQPSAQDYHQAGHAVVALHCQRQFAAVKSGNSENLLFEHARTAAPTNDAERHAEADAQVQIALAGLAAERISQGLSGFFPKDRLVQQLEQHHAGSINDYSMNLVVWERKVSELLRGLWPKVEALAKFLAEHGEATEGQARSIFEDQA